MVRSLYRKGRASHSDELRDARKVLFYAQAEVERLEAKLSPEWPTDDRIDTIGQNGNDGEHYQPLPELGTIDSRYNLIEGGSIHEHQVVSYRPARRSARSDPLDG